MKDFEYYLRIANCDILMARNQNELKDYVASLLYEYDELQQENQQLKDNWKKLKAFIVNAIPEEEFINNEYYVSILDKMKELEKGKSE